MLDIQIIVYYQGLGRRLPRNPWDRIRSQHALCVFLCMLGLYVHDCVWGHVLAWIRVIDPFLGALPSYKISWQFEFYVATDNGFSLWLQMQPRGTCSLGFGRNWTSKFLLWCSTSL